ncbi:MAG: HD domain-containing protein [Candidatus Brocadiales bacterium]|nr:HD domain-containing protein [Candidatus Brocadiales bacterium]
MSIDNEKAWKELITALALVLDLQEDLNYYHAWRVAVISTLLAEEILPEQKSDIFIAGLLHDVGAMSLPNHMTRYPSTSEQILHPIIRSHTIIGAQIVSDFPGFERVPSLILDHHEYWNGHGYPRAKKGKEIVEGAQLIRAADTFDIIFQIHPEKTLSEILNDMSELVNKEFNKSIFSSLKKIMIDGNLFHDLVDAQKLPDLLFKLRDGISVSSIKDGTDIMGTSLDMFGQIIDSKHAYTAGHSKRVSQNSMLIAISMNLSHDEVTRIKWSGLVHDIGKVAIPPTVLDKASELSEDEYVLLRKHTVYTEEILETVSCMKELVPIAAAHHERFDGNGYHHKLKGKEIPLGARILSVADAFDSMTSQRGYRDAGLIPLAIDEIKNASKTQFDPDVVEAAIPIFQSL